MGEAFTAFGDCGSSMIDDEGHLNTFEECHGST